MDQSSVTDEISADSTDQAQALDISNPKWTTSVLPEDHSDGSHGAETLHCHDDSGGVFTEDDHFALSNDGMSEFSNSDISLPEVCISSNTNSVKEEINYEVQQAYRIFSEFLTEKHKVMTSPFWNPTVNQDEETQCGSGGVCNRYPVNVRQSMCLHRMEEKFIHQEYETITEFVADFRLMLENCYRYHGVDHWLSKQAQKLEIMLEQKLTLLSRKLREKTTLVVTSKGRFGVGEEPASSSSTRRRHTRSIKTLTVGGHESIMVQTLRVEEQQRAREEKKQRELEKKEAEEISAKEMDEWEQNLLSQAFPHNVETLWELPAIGHFLCLAQSALNLPEIVFFELERCLLMPRCSILLSKIMSSLLCQPQRRSTLHRRPVLPYRRWESELRQRVRTWFQSVGSSHDQTARAEHLGLCHQFFSVLGKSSPLEAKAFHMLPFYQRVWLLKGLCDHVYETQRDIQMAVLAQPIHECRESILGYDSKENAYIHFPHFCGADLRIYRQSPSAPPNFPFPSVLVEKVELLHRLEEEMPSVTKSSSDVYRDSFDDKTVKEELYKTYKVETIESDVDRCRSWRPKPREHIQISNDEDSGDECKVEPHTNSSPIKGLIRKHILTEEKSEFDLKSKRLKNEMGSLCPLQRSESTHKLCLSDEEHCYTGRSPTGSVTGSPLRKLSIETSAVLGDQRQRCCKNRNSPVKIEPCQSCCGSSELHRTQMSTEHTRTFCEKDVNDKISTKNKKWRKKKERELLSRVKPEQRQPVDRRRCRAKTPKPSESNTAIKRKNKKRKRAESKAPTLSKKINEPHPGPSFKLICTNLDDLRELINKTEDELDDLESTKRKMSLWYGRRESVKDLHSTLIRLLNELTPWEPKLIKAHQRNRLRLKKEFEVFRSHPDYSNFVREESMSSSSSSSSSDNEGELGLLFEQCHQSGHVDPEHVLPRGLGGTVKDLSTEPSADVPVTHKSHNCPKQLLSGNLDYSLKNTNRSELNHQSSDSFSSQKQTIPLSKPSVLHSVSGQPKSYTPIPTLLAKSVGNKVTLMKQPADHLEIDSKGTVVSTGDTNLSKLNCSSGPPQNSSQKQVSYTVHKEQNPLVGTSSSNLKCKEMEPQQVVFLNPNILHSTDKEVTLSQQQSKDIISSEIDSTLCTSTNVAGFTIPESGTLVQQVPPSKNTGLTEASVCSSNIHSFFRSQPSAISNARSKVTQHCDVQPSAPQCSLHDITAPLSISKSTDSKQELKTVCIRESQSILVTTRGGNTGIVKVQKSTDHTVGFSKGPVITISPQFQALLVSKTSSVFSPNTGQSGSVSTASTGPTVQTGPETPSVSLNQEVSKYSSTTKTQGLTGSSVYTSTSNCGKTAVSCPLTVVKNANPALSNFITPPSLTAAELINQPRLNQTHADNGSHVAKFILISPPSAQDVKVSCTKTLPTSSMFLNQQTTTAKSPLIPVQCANTKQPTVGATQAMTSSASSSPLGVQTSSVNSVSVPKDKGSFLFSGTSTDPVKFPCVIATTIPQNTQSSTKCCDTKEVVTTTAQTVFTNSNGISTSPAPATSRSSLKHLGFSSITVNSQPRNVTCPSTKSLSADISKNLMWSSNSKVHPTTSQTTPSPISALSLKHKPLKNLSVSNATGHFDKTSLSPPLCFPRPEDSSDMPRSTEVPDIAKGLLTKPTTTSSQTSLTNSVQRQIVINTSTRLAGGTRIVLNNAHFVVPPQGLGPGSHVLVISGHAPQVPGSSVKTEETVPLQGVNKGQVLLQPSARLPGLPAIRSSYVACTPAVSCAGQAPSPIITAPRIHSPNNAVVVNQIDTAANSPFLQTANTGRPTEGASIVSTFPSLLPVVSSVLTSASAVGSSFRSECLTTSTASVGLSLPNLPPPVLSSAVFIQPIKTDPAHLLRAASTPCSQGLPSPAQMNKGLSISVASPVPSQHQTIRVASISSSTSTALMHMGLGSLAVKKQEHTAAHPVSTIAQTHSVPPAASPGTRTLPCSGGNVKGESNSGTCDTAARSLPHRKSPTHCPVIVTNPAMEKHLEQTSFLEMHCPVTSELLISPDASVLSSGQCKATSTLPETPSGLLISAAALQTEDLPSQPSQMDSKFDN